MQLLQIQDTAFRNARRYVFEHDINDDILNINNEQESLANPLTEAVWKIGNITRFNLKGRYLTVFGSSDIDWEYTGRFISRIFKAYEPVKCPPVREFNADWRNELSIEKLALLQDIENALDIKIRPLLLKDGGDISIECFDGTNLIMEYKGACRSCSLSQSSTLFFITNEINAVNNEIKIRMI